MKPFRASKLYIETTLLLRLQRDELKYHRLLFTRRGALLLISLHRVGKFLMAGLWGETRRISLIFKVIQSFIHSFKWSTIRFEVESKLN